MNENQQAEIEKQKIIHHEDEIELINILHVVWKWKYFIIAGIMVFGLIAMIISLNMDKIYSINMVLRPGILSIKEEGKFIHIDTPQNIKALIDSGTFNNDILNYLNEINADNIPKNLIFKVSIPKNSDSIKVQYETNDIKQGIVIQEHLSNLLLETYKDLVLNYKNDYEMELDIINSELDYIKVSIQFFKKNVKNIEKRIDDLKPEIELIKKNTANLIIERNKLLLKNPKENNILPALLYSNTIQQNLQLSNRYQDEINNYMRKKEDELQKIENSKKEIEKKINIMKNLQSKKDNIRNIQILQPPTATAHPIKPRLMLSVILSMVTGLLIFLFFSFFLEYLKNHKII